MIEEIISKLDGNHITLLLAMLFAAMLFIIFKGVVYKKGDTYIQIGGDRNPKQKTEETG